MSGYWSPLYSWLLMPWLTLGVPGLLVHYRTPRPDFGQLAAQLDEAARRQGGSLEGPIAGNHWHQTVSLAYTMNRPSYGSTTIEDLALLAAELSRLGIRTYLVFTDEALAERLKQSDGFRPLAELSMIPRATPPETLAAFEVPERSPGR